MRKAKQTNPNLHIFIAIRAQYCHLDYVFDRVRAVLQQATDHVH